MKKVKKLLSLVLVFTFLFALMGCSGGNNDTVNDSSTDAPATNMQQDTTSGDTVKEDINASLHSFWSADAPEVEATGEPIVIGGFACLTGANSAGGNLVYRGTEMAVEWINSHGGINGRPLEIIMYDDATTPEGAVKAVTRLMDEDEVSVILGSHMTPNVLAAMDYTEEAGIPLVSLGTGLSCTRCGAEYTIRGTFSGYSMYPTMLDAMVDQGEKSVAFFYAETDSGQAAANFFIQEGRFDDACIEVVETVPYPKAETDFTGHIAKALAKNPEAITIITAANTEYSLFVKQLRQQGFTGLVYGVENVGTHAVIETAGALANGSVFTSAILASPDPTTYTNEQAAYVVATYNEKYGELFSSEGTFRGWDGVMVIAQALSEVDDPADSEAIAEALWNMKNYQGCQGVFDYTARDGEGLPMVSKFMIQDESYLPYDRDAAAAMRGEGN